MTEQRNTYRITDLNESERPRERLQVPPLKVVRVRAGEAVRDDELDDVEAAAGPEGRVVGLEGDPLLAQAVFGEALHFGHLADAALEPGVEFHKGLLRFLRRAQGFRGFKAKQYIGIAIGDTVTFPLAKENHGLHNPTTLGHTVKLRHTDREMHAQRRLTQDP